MSKNHYAIKFVYQRKNIPLRMQYKKVEDFLENPLRDNAEFGFNFDTEIRGVQVKGVDNCNDIKTVRELYDFIKNYDFSKKPSKKRFIRTEMSAEELAKNHEIQYERKEIYTIEQIQNATKDVLFNYKHDADIILDGDIIHGNSQRYQTFFTKGVVCCKCGIAGRYFRKERFKNSKRYHLNLYAVNENGIEVLMTKDHIIPVSKGGKNILSNYQTMCELCNLEKGNNMEV